MYSHSLYSFTARSKCLGGGGGGGGGGGALPQQCSLLHGYGFGPWVDDPVCMGVGSA